MLGPQSSTSGSSHHRRRIRKPTRRTDVLYSSDEESSSCIDNGESSNDDAPSIIHSAAPRSGRVRQSPNNSNGTESIMNGTSSTKGAFGVGESSSTDEASDDDDAELMNPYVMNPFFGSNGSSGRLEYDSQALLPPSVEMASLASSGGDDGGMQQQQVGCGSSSPPTRPRQNTTLAGFDPYSPTTAQQQQQQYELEMEEEYIEFASPNRGAGRAGNNNNLKVFGSLLQDQQEASSGPSSSSPFPTHRASRSPSGYVTASGEGGGGYGESTPLSGDFAARHAGRGRGANAGRGPSGACPAGGVGAGGVAAVGGAMLDIIKAVASAASSTAAHAATTLVYGDSNHHHHRRSSMNNPFSNPRIRTNSKTNPRINPRMDRRRFGMAACFRLLVVGLAVLFCVGTMTAVSRMPPVGEGGDIRQNGQQEQNNGQQKQRQQQKQNNGQAYNAEGGSGQSSDAEEGEAAGRPSSIVLNKMKKAKRHWWSRNKSDAKSARQEEKGVHTEVYRNGEKDGAASSGGQQFEQQSQQHEQAQSVASNNSGGHGNVDSGNASDVLPAVIVQTEDDGTVLIKLPPPRMNMEQPAATAAAATDDVAKESTGGTSVDPTGRTEDDPPAVGSAIDPSGAAANDGDGTMYIRLPYPQQQRRQGQRRTMRADENTMKQELEPPLRGAAPVARGRHTPLSYHPPPPLAEPLAERASGGRHHEAEHPGVLHALRSEFDAWTTEHGKRYGTKEEREHRFGVWRKNHVRINEKNEKHGPCRMTGRAVFGHNLFSDLDPVEFQSKFLTGYRGPRHHNDGHRRSRTTKKKQSSYFREAKSDNEERPATKARSVKRHPSIQRKLEEHVSMYGASEGGSSGGSNSRLTGSKYQASFANGCKWWDVPCYLRWVFGYQYVGGTREPVYDESSYPSALDWRSVGVVTDVHSQGSCGACWAITAVETIESAHAIATGQLIDLAEEEVIACDGTCEMCNGGWPQNAYEYVMKHGGLPAKSEEYDADWLYAVTAVLAGESDETSEYDMGSYFAQTCPKGYREGDDGGGGSNSGSHKSGDSGYQYDVSYVETTRYGNVKGYGYATDRCVCYTDGSGCDCDDQDEKTAVLNVASYGPAAICLEASLWQDYEGGIMTSDIGCSKSFLDMNHCVAVVGYAFTDGSNDEEEGDGNNNSGSGSNDRNNSGSRDDQREGYWIVKNQWSNYWGMNGYAYLAMGDNTCGILNDMTQAYMS